MASDHDNYIGKLVFSRGKQFEILKKLSGIDDVIAACSDAF
jgi:hypothetical protein